MSFCSDGVADFEVVDAKVVVDEFSFWGRLAVKLKECDWLRCRDGVFSAFADRMCKKLWGCFGVGPKPEPDDL